MPERTCAGCRKVFEKSGMIRFASAGGALTMDKRGLTGRGVYVCPKERCIREASKKGAFARALKEPGLKVPGADDLIKAVEETETGG